MTKQKASTQKPKKTAKKTARQTTKKARNTTHKASQAAQKTVKKVADNAGSAARAAQEQSVNQTKKATRELEKTMTQGQAKFEKLTKEASNASKEQLDAVMQSGAIWMKGYEDLMKTCMSWANSSAEKNAQAVKTLMSCRTLNEFTEAQNKVVQQNFDDFMKSATKLSELSVRISSEALEPINGQFSKTVKKTTEAMAA